VHLHVYAGAAAQRRAIKSGDDIRRLHCPSLEVDIHIQINCNTILLNIVSMASNSASRVVIYPLRRDLRLSDNPVFHELCREYSSEASSFTHILPLYVFPAHQVEISGFIPDAATSEATPESPYPEARSRLASFWRCGPHRIQFLTESLLDLKQSLNNEDSDLVLRAGLLVDVIRDVIQYLQKESTADSDGGAVESRSCQAVKVVGVWMTSDEGFEEKKEQEELQNLLESQGKQFRLFQDEKYFVDEYVPPIFSSL
jgi:deoxyribodipyrimidine photo-lyase